MRVLIGERFPELNSIRKNLPTVQERVLKKLSIIEKPIEKKICSHCGQEINKSLRPPL